MLNDNINDKAPNAHSRNLNVQSALIIIQMRFDDLPVNLVSD